MSSEGRNSGSNASAAPPQGSRSSMSKPPIAAVGVQQPKPETLSRPGASSSSILVSHRQKGNPILTHIRHQAWEYADIPADYVLGATTCALFLSLKYHRLHPEYIYGRIRDLQGKYNLRILLVMVDIETHEESLKELSKTSLINNVTVVLSWSAQEAGRYLELYKTYEHAAPTSIKAHQSADYTDRLVDFITVPRSVNKTDAIGLVSNFGTIRTAINARPEEISLIAGWGEKKVQRWCTAVREPFRTKRSGKRTLPQDKANPAPAGGDEQSTITLPLPISRPVTRPAQNGKAQGASIAGASQQDQLVADTPVLQRKPQDPRPAPVSKKRPAEPGVGDGVLAALAKLRDQG
jgi:DNA excision repair protein ERCC-1